MYLYAFFEGTRPARGAGRVGRGERAILLHLREGGWRAELPGARVEGALGSLESGISRGISGAPITLVLVLITTTSYYYWLLVL